MNSGEKYYARVQLWGKTKEEWNNENPILRLNEIGIETDTKQFKIGDGKTSWIGLDYYFPKKLTHTDGSTLSLASNKIEITNSDGAHLNTKSALTSFRIYFEDGQNKKSWFDIDELYLSNADGQTTVNPTIIKVSNVEKTSFTQINQSYIKTQKDQNNYVQYGWDSVSNRPYFQMTKDDTITNYFGYDNIGPYYRMISLGGGNLVESSETIVLPNTTCDLEELEGYITYLIKLPNTSGDIPYSTNFVGDDIDIGYGQHFIGDLIELEDGYDFSGLEILGECLDFTSVSPIKTTSGATYIAFDFPIDKITNLIIQQGVKVVEAGTSWLRPAGLTFKTNSDTELALNFNSSTDSNPYLLFQDAGKNKVKIGLNEFKFYQAGAAFAWFNPSEFRIRNGWYHIQGSTNSTQSILQLWGDESQIALSARGSSPSITLTNKITGDKMQVGTQIISEKGTYDQYQAIKCNSSGYSVIGRSFYEYNTHWDRVDLTSYGLKYYSCEGIYDNEKPGNFGTGTYFLTPDTYTGTAAAARRITQDVNLRISVHNGSSPSSPGSCLYDSKWTQLCLNYDENSRSPNVHIKLYYGLQN